MHALTEEDTRRAMQLRYDDTFSTVDDERSVAGHIRNGSKENILDKRTKILMVRISTVKLHLCFQRHTVGQSTLQTFVDGVTWRINKVVKKLKNEIVSRIGDGEVLCKHLEQSIILAFLRWCVQL